MEFTKEFIGKQRAIFGNATETPWALCTCGKCTQIHSIPMDVEVVDVKAHVPNCHEEGFPYSTRWHADAKYIEQACNNYPSALVEIERLQARIAERRWIPVSERLPEIGEIVSWTHPAWTRRVKEGFLTGEGSVVMWGGETYNIKKMKWQPSPQPPEEE